MSVVFAGWMNAFHFVTSSAFVVAFVALAVLDAVVRAQLLPTAQYAALMALYNATGELESRKTKKHKQKGVFTELRRVPRFEHYNLPSI